LRLVWARVEYDAEVVFNVLAWVLLAVLQSNGDADLCDARELVAFDNLDIDTGAGGDVLAGVGKANSDALSEGGGGESQDCDGVFHN